MKMKLFGSLSAICLSLACLADVAAAQYSVPSNLPCADVASWIKNNSPYAPEWAATRCSYAFPPSIPFNWKPLADGTVEATVSPDNKRTVGVNCPVDRPEWSPDARPKQAAEAAAYSAMRRALDAHEAEHRKIGKTWHGTLESRYKALAFKVIAANEREAGTKVTEKGKKEAAKWEAEAQAAQNAIDPFRGAILTCP